MRYRIDFAPEGLGYASYDESQLDEVLRLWKEEPNRFLRVRKCQDIHDTGELFLGLPIYEEHRSYGLN